MYKMKMVNFFDHATHRRGKEKGKKVHFRFVVVFPSFFPIFTNCNTQVCAM